MELWKSLEEYYCGSCLWLELAGDAGSLSATILKERDIHKIAQAVGVQREVVMSADTYFEIAVGMYVAGTLSRLSMWDAANGTCGVL